MKGLKHVFIEILKELEIKPDLVVQTIEKMLDKLNNA